MLLKSSGILRYSILPEIKAYVEIDWDIARYYRRLVPKHIWGLKIPMYPPHISVVRKEIPKNLKVWSKYAGKKVDFEYDNFVHIGKVYVWLNVFSKQLEEIRLELGLERHRSNVTRPPDGARCFHTTIANFK